MLKGPPAPLREVNPKASPALVRIAEGCLARELRDRYASMADVVADLARAAGGEAAVGSRGRGLGNKINLRRLAATVVISLTCAAVAVGLLQVAGRWSHSVGSVSGWQATLEKAAKAYDENRIEEAISLYDDALAAMSADQKTDPSVRKFSQDKARKGRSLAGFILDRGKLPLSQQIELTQQKLAEFNTNYTGKGTFTATKEGQIIAGLEKTGITDLMPLKGLPLTELNLDSTSVADLTPLREMKLDGLSVTGTPVADLAPLKGMSLRRLSIYGSKVVDLRPLSGMITLTNLQCGVSGIRDIGSLQGMPLRYLGLFETPVSDLRPLKGMPLDVLWIERCPNLTDISPLNGIPLEDLDFSATPVTDIRPLKGMPLKRLRAWGASPTDLSPLRTLKSLVCVEGIDPKPLLNDLYTALRTNGLAQAKQEAASLIADCQSAPAFSNVVAEAREIQTALAQLTQGDTRPYAEYWRKHLKERGILRNYGFTCDTNGLITLNLNHGCLVSNKVTLDALHDVPLRAVYLSENNLTNLQALAGLPLKDLDLEGNPVTDLSPLRGMKLESLGLYATPVADLAPLNGMTSLIDLNCGYTGIRDVGPLQGMPLRKLSLGATGVSDLAPLQGMPLRYLVLWSTGVSNLVPLDGMPLEYLELGGAPVNDLRFLKGMPLKSLNLGDCLNVTNISPIQGMPLVDLFIQGVPLTDLSTLKSLKTLAHVEGVELKLLLKDLYTALRTNGLAQAKQEADSLIADCQSAPAFSNVVAEAREIQTALARLAQGNTGAYAQYWWKHLTERGVNGGSGWQCDSNGLITVNLNRCLSLSSVTLDALNYVPLRSVDLQANNLTNLQALAGLPLTELNMGGNLVADLSPLRGMKLVILDLSSTPVADLAPLKGMPLKRLRFSGTKVVDLSALQGMASLTDLDCSYNGIRDVGPLKGMPLKELSLCGTKVADLNPLQGMPLEALWLRESPVSDLRPLKGMPLKHLSVSYCPNVTDISPLQGLPLTGFYANETGIADLSPLAGMPLELLELIGATHVTSIAALRGMKLTRLSLTGTQVADVTVVQGMPLKELWLQNTRVAVLMPQPCNGVFGRCPSAPGRTHQNRALYVRETADFPLRGHIIRRIMRSEFRRKDCSVR